MEEVQLKSLLERLNGCRNIKKSALSIYTEAFESITKRIFYTLKLIPPRDLSVFFQTPLIKLYESNVGGIISCLEDIEVSTRQFLHTHRTSFSAYTPPAYHNPEEEINEELNQLRALKERLTPFGNELLDLTIEFGAENIQPMTEEILTSIRYSIDNHLNLVVQRISILIDHQIGLIEKRIIERTATETYIKATATPIKITEIE